MDRRKFRVLIAHRGARVGFVLLALLAALSASIALGSPHDPERLEDGNRHRGSSWTHLLGTDYGGRDILTRLAYGTWLSVRLAVTAVALSATIGIVLGAIAAYFGGGTDFLISRVLDILLAFPSILLAIAIAAAMGPGEDTVILSVGIVGIPQFARQVRASVLVIRELDYVTACRALGFGHPRILAFHVIPNALGPIVVLSTLSVGSAILSAAGLSFLGLGVEAGTPEWGAMLHDGYEDRQANANLAFAAGAAISITVLAINLVGDGLRDALDPRSIS